MDERLLSAWPEDVAAYYRDLAARRGWPESVALAFSQSVDYYRRLDEGQEARTHWHGTDLEGAQWFFEAVRNRDATLVPVRQVVIEVDGTRKRYSWRRLEDDGGGMAEGSLDDWIENVDEISAQEFEAAWMAP